MVKKPAKGPTPWSIWKKLTSKLHLDLLIELPSQAQPKPKSIQQLLAHISPSFPFKELELI